jgi:amino acid transporter
MVNLILNFCSVNRLTFIFPGALPLSRFLYNIHPTQKIPMRCVWASGIVAILIGMIALGGAAASGALFTLGIVGQYLANSLVISARWLGGHEFVHGPFNLGAAVRLIFSLYAQYNLTLR